MQVLSSRISIEELLNERLVVMRVQSVFEFLCQAEMVGYYRIFNIKIYKRYS